MLVPAREFNHLGDFCFRHLEGEYAANTHAVAMDMKHDLDGLFPPLVEESLEDGKDKLHRRVVVVQDENLVEAGLLGLGACLRDDARSGAVALLVSVPRVFHPRKYRAVRRLSQRHSSPETLSAEK